MNTVRISRLIKSNRKEVRDRYCNVTQESCGFTEYIYKTACQCADVCQFLSVHKASKGHERRNTFHRLFAYSCHLR